MLGHKRLSPGGARVLQLSVTTAGFGSVIDEMKCIVPVIAQKKRRRKRQLPPPLNPAYRQCYFAGSGSIVTRQSPGPWVATTIWPAGTSSAIGELDR